MELGGSQLEWGWAEMGGLDPGGKASREQQGRELRGPGGGRAGRLGSFPTLSLPQAAQSQTQACQAVPMESMSARLLHTLTATLLTAARPPVVPMTRRSQPPALRKSIT